jgi:hypothetical protein
MPCSPTIIAHLGHSPTTTTTPSTLVSFWALVKNLLVIVEILPFLSSSLSFFDFHLIKISSSYVPLSSTMFAFLLF